MKELLKTKTIEELLERRTQIKTECESEGADLEGLKAEAEMINAELEERKKVAAQEEEHRKEVATSNITIEINKGEKTMNITRDSNEYRQAWIRNLMGRLTDEDREILKEARAFTTSNTYAIPTKIADRVVETLEKITPLVPEIELYRATGTIQVPYEATVTDAYSHTENAAITAATDTLSYVSLSQGEIVKLVQVSKNALKQSEDQFETWLINKLSKKIGEAMDNVIVTALGSGTFTANTNAIIDTNGLSYTALANVVSLLPAALEAGAKWVMNKKTLWSVKGIVGNDGHPVFDANSKELLSFPVIVDDNVSSSNSLLYFGNLFEAVKGATSGEIEVEGTEYGEGFSKAMVDFRGYTTFAASKVGTVGIIKFATTA